MNIIDKIEQEQIKDVADFNVGDSLKVHTRVVEGGKERIQIFAGLKKKNAHAKNQNQDQGRQMVDLTNGVQ